MKHALLCIFLTTAATYTAQHDLERACIIDLDRPTYWTVYFANDKKPYHLYPPEIIDRLIVVKAAKHATSHDNSQVLDLSRTPGVTAENFNTLAHIIIDLKRKPTQDKLLLELLGAADVLLGKDDDVHRRLIHIFIRTLRTKFPGEYKDESGTFLKMLTNQQAAAVVAGIQRLAHTPNSTSCSYSKKIETLTYDSICTNITEWPVPNYTTGKPDITDFPISIEDLIKAKEADPAATLLKLSSKHLTSLVGLERFSNIITLDLSHNKLQIIKAGTFTHLKNLKELDLSDNQIEKIESEDDPSTSTRAPTWFPHLPKCTILLADNPITRPSGWFDRWVLGSDYNLVMNRE